jgi:hypothetical protein
MARTLPGVAALEQSCHKPGIEPTRSKLRIREHELLK